MKVRQIAALLGLDETEAVRPVPLVLPEDSGAPALPAPPPNRAQRRREEQHQRRERPSRNLMHRQG